MFIQKLCLISFPFFQKLIKGGVGIRAGGLENFSRINKRGGDDYSVLESTFSVVKFPALHKQLKSKDQNS